MSIAQLLHSIYNHTNMTTTMSTILEIRKRLGVTQKAFAEGIGVTQGNVSFYERSQQTVPPKVAAKLIAYAAALGHVVTFDEIYAGELATPSPAEPAKVER